MSPQIERQTEAIELSNKRDTECSAHKTNSTSSSPEEAASIPDVLTLVPSNTIEQEDIPPDGGYGWIITICVFLINANTWGVNSAWAIFLARYLAQSTFPGASQFEYGLIGGLSISQSLLVSPLVAMSNRKLGTRVTLMIGSFLVSTAWLGASFATRIWHLFLSVGCCFGFGMGFLYITAAQVLPQWFLRHRSLSVGIASSGAGLGGLAYNLGAGAGIESLGLPWTYRMLAICSFVCNFGCSLVMKDRNKMVKPSLRSFDHKELGRLEVDLVIAWGFLTELGYIVLLFSLPHYAASIGLTQKQGSVIGAVLNLGLGLARPVIGYSSDRWGRINMAALMTALCGLWCLAIWVPAHSYGVLLLFALLAGTVCGNYWGTVTAVTTEVVGLQRLPSVFGIICMCLVLPTTFAEPLGLQIVSGAGYASAQVFVGMGYLVAAACVWMLRSWKVTEMDLKAHIENGGATRPRAMQILKPSNLFSWRRV